MIRKTLFVVLILIVSMTVFAQDTIDIGDTVEDTLPQGERLDYTFTASEGDALVISLVSDEFDAYLYLLDADGGELARNDDGGDGLNSLINFIVPEDGEYIIQAASFSDGGTGAFELTLSTVELILISYGDVIEGDGSIPTANYTFTGEEGDVIVANLRGTGFDTFIQMTDEQGFNIASSYYIDGSSTRLGPYVLEEDGTYFLNVRAEGESVFRFNSVNPIELTVGEATTAEFDAETAELYFSLELDRSQVLDLVVDSNNLLDTKMSVISPFGYSIRDADDGEGTVDPSLPGFVMDASGIHYIVLSASNPNATLIGEVSLNVTLTELASLEEGTAELNFDFTINEQVLVFDGVADERVSLRIEVETESSFLSPYIEILQDDETVASLNQFGIKDATITFVIPADGEVSIAVRVYSEATIRLTLDRGE